MPKESASTRIKNTISQSWLGITWRWLKNRVRAFRQFFAGFFRKDQQQPLQQDHPQQQTQQEREQAEAQKQRQQQETERAEAERRQQEAQQRQEAERAEMERQRQETERAEVERRQQQVEKERQQQGERNKAAAQAEQDRIAAAKTSKPQATPLLTPAPSSVTQDQEMAQTLITQANALAARGQELRRDEEMYLINLRSARDSLINTLETEKKTRPEPYSKIPHDIDILRNAINNMQEAISKPSTLTPSASTEPAAVTPTPAPVSPRAASPKIKPVFDISQMDLTDEEHSKKLNEKAQKISQVVRHNRTRRTAERAAANSKKMNPRDEWILKSTDELQTKIHSLRVFQKKTTTIGIIHVDPNELANQLRSYIETLKPDTNNSIGQDEISFIIHNAIYSELFDQFLSYDYQSRKLLINQIGEKYNTKLKELGYPPLLTSEEEIIALRNKIGLVIPELTEPTVHDQTARTSLEPEKPIASREAMDQFTEAQIRAAVAKAIENAPQTEIGRAEAAFYTETSMRRELEVNRNNAKAAERRAQENEEWLAARRAARAANAQNAGDKQEEVSPSNFLPSGGHAASPQPAQTPAEKTQDLKAKFTLLQNEGIFSSPPNDSNGAGDLAISKSTIDKIAKGDIKSTLPFRLTASVQLTRAFYLLDHLLEKPDRTTTQPKIEALQNKIDSLLNSTDSLDLVNPNKYAPVILELYQEIEKISPNHPLPPPQEKAGGIKNK